MCDLKSLVNVWCVVNYAFWLFLECELICAKVRIFLMFCFAKIFEINVCFDIIRVGMF